MQKKIKYYIETNNIEMVSMKRKQSELFKRKKWLSNLSAEYNKYIVEFKMKILKNQWKLDFNICYTPNMDIQQTIASYLFYKGAVKNVQSEIYDVRKELQKISRKIAWIEEKYDNHI